MFIYDTKFLILHINLKVIKHAIIACNASRTWTTKKAKKFKYFRWFNQVPLLTRVSIQNNSLTKLPSRAFTNLKGPKQFGSVTLTINLIFSYNKISEIAHTTFADLDKINNLWLDNNQLLDFPANLLQNVSVSDLRIGYNHITCLDGKLTRSG